MIKTTVLLLLLLPILQTSCRGEKPRNGSSQPVQHTLWDELLKKHVSDAGMADYRGFDADRDQLTRYLRLLSENPPHAEQWSQQQQLAYWINAYNAFTVELVLRHYPIESIKDIGSAIQVPFVNTPWDIKFIEIGGVKMDLNQIEHGILRKDFDEPRIHFAINCASFSCPVLIREAFSADKIEQQLHARAVAFINDPARNKIGKKKVQLSKIFRWFQGDFTQNGTLIEYLNRYSKTRIDKNAEITFMDYDWTLNDVQNADR